MNRLNVILLLSLLVIGFFIRLYKFSEPLADWHSFRQSDTAAVSQIFVDEGYNLLYPKYYDISNVQSGFDNPNGYRFVEFPIYNFFHAFLYKTIGIFSFNEWGRMINILASLVTAFVVFSLLRRYIGLAAGYAGLCAYLFLPFSIFYSRVILPDVMMTSAIFLGIYFFDKYLEPYKERRLSLLYYLLSLLFTSLSFLLKPFALFFIIPFVYLAYDRYGLKMLIKWQLYLFGIVTLAPLIAWRNWISQFPEGIPVSDWLFNGNNIRFRPSFFRWILFERITKLILGYFGVLFLLSSLFILKSKKSFLFIAFGLSSILYLLVIATGNVQHDYYQIIIIPTICMFVGIGIDMIYKFLIRRINHNWAFVIIIAIFTFSFYFSWVQIKDYFNINDRGMVMAGEKANEILPKDAVVIAPYDGSTVFLNTIKRRGWPVFQQDIEELILEGAQYLVIANPTPNDFSGFGTQYKVVDSSKDYLILQLK